MHDKLFKGDWKNLAIHLGLYGVTLVLFGYFFDIEDWRRYVCLFLAIVSLEVMLNHLVKWDLKLKHKNVRIDNYLNAARITYDDGHSVLLFKTSEDVTVENINDNI